MPLLRGPKMNLKRARESNTTPEGSCFHQQLRVPKKIAQTADGLAWILQSLSEFKIHRVHFVRKCMGFPAFPVLMLCVVLLL